MNIDKREQLIESVGVNATEIIIELERKINELERFLGVVPVYKTTGFRYETSMDQVREAVNDLNNRK